MSIAEKFKDDRHFEERIVQALIVDHNFAEQMLEVLNVDYFNVDYLKEVTNLLFNYYEKYSAFPSFRLLASMIKTEISNDLLKNQIGDYLLRIHREPLNGDLEYVKETSLDFCKRRSLFIALEESLDLIGSKKYEQILPRLQKALLAGSDRNIGHVFLEQFENRMIAIKKNPVPTPWPQINEIMHGGLSGGELGIIMGITSAGKSHCLVDIGQNAACNGFNVAHYTLELGDIYVGKRYDSRLSDVPFDDLLDHKERVQESLSKIKGNVIIKSFPAKSVTTLAIKNHINQLVLRDMRPDLIIVDYGDLIRSTRHYEQKRLEEEAAFEELRALCQELDLPMWTATQANREGMDVEVLTLRHVAECFGKAMISDFFLTMTRKKENTSNALGNFYVAKSRLGPDGIKFPILVSTSISKINVLDPDSTDDDSDGNSRTKLKEAFKEFSRNH